MAPVSFFFFSHFHTFVVNTAFFLTKLLLVPLLYPMSPPPSCRNAAMRLPQPRLGQRNSVSSISRRSIAIATAKVLCDCRITFFASYYWDRARFRDYFYLEGLEFKSGNGQT